VVLPITVQQYFDGVDDSIATQLQLTGRRWRARVVIPVLDLSGAARWQVYCRLFIRVRSCRQPLHVL
jgi:hypothetical protein